MTEKPEDRLKRLIRKAIDECCLRDAVNSTWLATPIEAEQNLIDELLPFAKEFPQQDKQETQTETLLKLQELGRRFKHLVAFAEKANTEVTVSDVQLDVARLKEKISTLEWFIKEDLPERTALGQRELIGAQLTETKRQLEALEVVVQCT